MVSVTAAGLVLHVDPSRLTRSPGSADRKSSAPARSARILLRRGRDYRLGGFAKDGVATSGLDGDLVPYGEREIGSGVPVGADASEYGLALVLVSVGAERDVQRIVEHSINNAAASELGALGG